MKIAGTGQVQTSRVRRRREAGSSQGAGFASELTSTATPARAGAAQGIGGVDGLLSIQEVVDDDGGRRRGRERGEALLRRLEELRLALLTGTVPARSLDRLLSQLRAGRGEIADPRVHDVLDEIELRVSVELAKLGRAV